MQAFVKQVPSIISADPLDEAAGAAERRRGRRADREPSERRDFAIGAAPARRSGSTSALAALVPEFSRSHLQQLIEAGHGAARRRGGHQGRRTTVRAGAAGRIELRPTPQSQAFTARGDAARRACTRTSTCWSSTSRPAWWCTRRRATGAARCSTACWRATRGAALLPRAGIVHRLDKDTSGLMVVGAHAAPRWTALVRADRGARGARASTSRWRIARWQGAGARHVDAPIGRDPRNRLRMAVVDLQRHAGKPARDAVERWTATSRAAPCAARCRPGARTRSACTWPRIGHPLVGDTLYGGAPAAGMQRQALHAFRLAFAHPVTRRAAGLRARRCRPIWRWQALGRPGALRYNRSRDRLRRAAPAAARCASLAAHQRAHRGAGQRHCSPSEPTDTARHDGAVSRIPRDHEYGGCQARPRNRA